MAFCFTKLEIPEIIYIESDIHSDRRGCFSEMYKYPEFQKNGIDKTFIQMNQSKSLKGVLRGLHYQKNPMAQGKMVSVVDGEIFNAVVDIRKGSTTYGKWIGVTLNDEKKQMMYIPEGFAHGFCVLSETAQVIYYCTEIYASQYVCGILWSDPELSISWPIKNPILSDQDAELPLLNRADNNFDFKQLLRCDM